jgi:predicted RNA-binding Zn-ribbon protein involved in translation (DUF1610 family)
MFGRMFIGRNGPDHLSLALLILAMVLSFVPWTYMFIICIALTLLAVWRMFSKNIDKRRKENLVLLKLVNNTKTWYYRINTQRQQNKQYKIFKCPQCGQKLRVPRGKGKVSIKCSKCGNKLIKTT